MCTQKTSFRNMKKMLFEIGHFFSPQKSYASFLWIIYVADLKKILQDSKSKYYGTTLIYFWHLFEVTEKRITRCRT